VSLVSYLLGLASAVVVLGLVIELLRRRHLRGKYALLYLVLAAAVSLVALVPSLLGRVAHLLGVMVPANLLFFAAIIVLLMVSMQLAYESGRLEEETRTLAEEVGLVRLELEQLREQVRGVLDRAPVDGPQPVDRVRDSG
jgi:hypothetical protein